MTNIDTDSIITKLMTVERQPQDSMKARVTALQTSQNAWQAIADKLTALKTASDSLTGLGALAALRTVSSSDPTSISVRSTGASTNANSSIDVISLAAAQTVLASDTFTDATASISGRTLDITKAGGSPQTFTSADGTIGGLVSAINASGVGVTARLVQTTPGQYQLSLTSSTTGTASAFTTAGTGWGTLTTVRPAADAQLQVDGVLLTRSTNVVSDVIDGVELTLLKPSTAVGISSARDDAAITAKVKAMVDAANSLGTMVAAATKTNPTDATARGPLAGDYTARRVMDSVRDAIASAVFTTSTTPMTASDLGVSLNKDGTLAFDATALQATLASRPADALAALGSSTTSNVAGVTIAGVTSAATASSRMVTVTQAASQAGLVGVPVPAPPAGTSVSMHIVTPSGSYDVQFVAGSSWAQTAGNLNAALRAAGVKVTASTQNVGGVDQGLNLTADRFGTGQAFTVSGATAVGLDGAAADGANALGTIDGVAFVANGKSVVTNGVILTIGTTAGQLAALGGTTTGAVTLSMGLAGALSTIGATGATGGPILGSKDTLQSQIDDLNDRISRYDDTLKQREDVLRAKFSAMQTMIDKLNSSISSINQLTASG